MARNMSSPAFLLATLVFFAATTLLAHAQILRPILPTPPPATPNITLPTNVTGQLFCPNGTTGGQPQNGTHVSLICTNATTGATNVVGQNTTNANGTYIIKANITVPNTNMLPTCALSANSSDNTCATLQGIFALVTFFLNGLGQLGSSTIPVVNVGTN